MHLHGGLVIRPVRTQPFTCVLGLISPVYLSSSSVVCAPDRKLCQHQGRTVVFPRCFQGAARSRTRHQTQLRQCFGESEGVRWIFQVKSVEEIDAVVDLTATAFAAEVRGSGLSSPQWQGLEKAHLINNPPLWRHVGVAVENGTVLGVAILKFCGSRERTLTFWQLVGRIGLLATLWSYVSNQLLVDDLGPHEALADMIVVAPQARGRGIGVALMRWCEAAAVAEFPTEPHVKLHLWVAAETPAVHLYEKAGFSIEKRTAEDCSAWIMSYILLSFLGHAHWYRMVKVIMQPAPVGPARPLLKQLSMKAIEGIPEGRAIGVMWPPAQPTSDEDLLSDLPLPIDRPQKMVFWRTQSGRVDLNTGEDWRIGAGGYDHDDEGELSDDELIRRFEESVGTPTGTSLTGRLQKLGHEGMQPAASDAAAPLDSPLAAVLPCLDPLTQEGQVVSWRLQHQKSFGRESIGTEVPNGHGSWLASTGDTQGTIKEHLQNASTQNGRMHQPITLKGRQPRRSTSTHAEQSRLGALSRDVVIDFRRRTSSCSS